MPVEAEVEKLIVVWNQDREAFDLIREFLEPLGYRVEFAPAASAAGEAAD